MMYKVTFKDYYDEAQADAWLQMQADLLYWEMMDAQYAEDRKNFLEAMDALYEDLEGLE